MPIKYTPTKNHFPIEDFLKKKENFKKSCSLYKVFDLAFNMNKDENIDGYSTTERIVWVKNRIFAEFKLFSQKLVIHSYKPIDELPIIGESIPKSHNWSFDWKYTITDIDEANQALYYINRVYKES